MTAFGWTSIKIRPLRDAIAWRRSVKGTVAFTNGVFDLLHVGHVELLESCRARASAMIVGLNSDVSVRTLDKGPDRPVIRDRDRARLLAALAAVDCVVMFDEPTPLELILALEPDVLCKGSDYHADTIVGAEAVRARGGTVATIPLVPGQSTTRLLERLRATS